MTTDEALRYAQERDLDLVEVAPEARPPVCRVLDYSKYKYEQAQKLKAGAQAPAADHDPRDQVPPEDRGATTTTTKKGHVERFLRHKDKVKVTIMFRGREVTHPERGVMILDRLAEELAELAVIEQRPLQDGRNMTMMLGPSQGRAQRRARRLAAGARRGDAGARRPRSAAAAAPRSPRADEPRPAAKPPPRRARRAARGRADRRVRRPPAARTDAFCHTAALAMPKMKTHSGAKKRFKMTAKRQGPRRATPSRATSSRRSRRSGSASLRKPADPHRPRRSARQEAARSGSK